MHLISKIIDNIQKYGNCKIYLPSNEFNENIIIDFLVDYPGSINIAMKEIEYDKSYWNGQEVNKNANIIRISKNIRYSGKGLSIVLAYIIEKSLENTENILIESNEYASKINTDSSVIRLYWLITQMLKLNNRELLSKLIAKNKEFEDILISKANAYFGEMEINPQEVSYNIEEQIKILQNRLTIIEEIKTSFQNCHNNEYENILLELNSLLNNSEIKNNENLKMCKKMA